jgi:hypothetical protein
MRHGTAPRRRTPTQDATWMPPGIQVVRWRRHSRRFDLRELAERANGVTLSRQLLHALLDELHVSDDFDRLAGPLSGQPASQYPRLLAIALLVRHSWSPQDLARTAARLGLPLADASPPEPPHLNTRPIRDRGLRGRVPRRARPSGPRTR